MASKSAIHRVLFEHGRAAGEDVKTLQRAVNSRLAARKIVGHTLRVDGEYGPKTHAAALLVLYLLGVTRRSVGMKTRNPTGLSRGAQAFIRLERTRNHWQLRRADSRLGRYRKAHREPLRERAYRIAASQVGVMESGGNNLGTPFTRYQKSNAATGPEPWCGDFQAWVYRTAGSKAVQRLWASVFWLGRIAGLHKTSKPQRGDLVRFTFSHVGMYVRHVNATTIETIEGNTGPSGAVSDGDGHDGVYRKHRSTSLVLDYLRVER